MQVQLGNSKPLTYRLDPSGQKVGVPTDIGAPTVTTIELPDSRGVTPGASGLEALRHVSSAGTVTHLPGSEALLDIVASNGIWNDHAQQGPTWVWSDNPELQRQLAEYYGCPEGRPADVEETHYTRAGAPGVVPAAAVEMTSELLNVGRDHWARALGGEKLGAAGPQNAAHLSITTSSLVDTDATFTPSAYVGHRVICGQAMANIIGNTATALTLDGWVNPATLVPLTSGQVTTLAGSSPSYVVTDGAPPAWYMALSTSTATPPYPMTDVSLGAELTTSGGYVGLVRQQGTFAHTAGVNTYSLAATWTAQSADLTAGGGSVTITRIGTFISPYPSATNGTMQFETPLSSSAQLTGVGDNLTCTLTVTGS